MKAVVKVQSWDQDTAKDVLRTRLELAKEHRKQNFESQWKANESALFTPDGDPSLTPGISWNTLSEAFQVLKSTTAKRVHIPRVMQNLRFLQSQMSANPVSVIPKATSNELSDRRAAEAADDFISYGRKRYKFQEYTDLTSLSTLTYGTGFLKAYHCPYSGEVVSFDEAKSELLMSGDFKARPVIIWDLWLDRDATCWEDVRYVFERKLMPYEEALSIWPEYAELFAANLVDAKNHPSRIGNLRSDEHNSNAQSDEDLKNSMVEIYEYIEKALPENGMAGRRCFHVEDGSILGKMQASPYPNGEIPVGILTDIDVPGEVYGKTTVDYALRLASVVDMLDNMVLKNIKLHGSIKLVVFNQSETNDDNYTDDPVDIITVNGTHAHAPYQLKPASVSSDVYNLRTAHLEAIDGIMGVNEILKGQINRELSGFASQTAINAANMVRHRLFNKYTMFVEFLFETYLKSVRQNWKTKRKLQVLGSEDGPTIRYLEGADIESGYVLTVEYGTNFSLDPALRREEIMQARDVLMEAGVNPKKIAQMLRYNEIDNLFDAVEMARKRQLEIFEDAIALFEKTGRVEVQPANVMRKAYHLEMAEAALEFVMTQDFLKLDRELQEAIYSHIDQREELAAAQAQPAAAGQPPGQPGMPAPGGAPLPLGGPMPPEQPMPDISGVL